MSYPKIIIKKGQSMMPNMFGQSGGIMAPQGGPTGLSSPEAPLGMPQMKMPNTPGREYGSLIARQIAPWQKMQDSYKRMGQPANARDPWRLAAKKFKGHRRDFPMRTLQGGRR